MPVTMKRTTDFLPLILPYCPTCPDFVAEQAVRFTAIDFAERSRAWRHIVTADIRSTKPESLLTGLVGGTLVDLLFTWNAEEYQAKTGEFEYEAPLAIDPVATIHEIEFAEFNGRKLTPIQFSTMNSPEAGAPLYVTQVRPGVVAVIPQQDGVLKMSVFLKPSSSSQYGTDPAHPLFDRYNVVPDFFLSVYGNTLAAGALERILSIPDEPWSNAKEAGRYGAEYNRKADASFRANMRGQQRAKIRTRYQDF